MYVEFKDAKALVLSPHTDDLEFNCSGLISRILKAGGKVNSLVFSSCEESVPSQFDKFVLRQECVDAHKSLGIGSLELLDFEVRKFPAFRQKILEVLIRARKKLNPNLVVLPSRTDIHQDHKVICEEGIRAFKHCTILGYDCPWNNLSTDQALAVELSTDDLDRKKMAIQTYSSQQHRMYSTEEFQNIQSRYNGMIRGLEYAELYEIIRMVWCSNNE